MGNLGLAEMRAERVSARAKGANYCLWGVSGSRERGWNKGERVAKPPSETGGEWGV